MYPIYLYVCAFGTAVFITVLSVPVVKRIALYFHFVDIPNSRKVHTKVMPRLGGVSIALGFAAGFLVLQPHSPYLPAFIIGALIVIGTGILDDKYNLPARLKFIAQIIAAIVFVSNGPVINFVSIPFIGYIQFGWVSYPLTIFWIIMVTNAINLIDGLDGLADGVSSIALISLLIMAIINHQVLAVALTIILLGGTLGFLVFNFHPARIFMGDCGSMFIGYTIAAISVAGLFKSLTLFSLILPIIILAVPIFDTFLAFTRRLMNGQNVFKPDNQHLHHRLITAGFSHRTTVLIIYVISLFFNISAIILSKSIQWGGLLILVLCVTMLQFIVELVDVLNHKRKPIIKTVKKLAALKETLRGEK